MKTTPPQKSSLPPSNLAIRGDSRAVFKQKPKIRIIHIVAPEIIKTDVEHFREIVQRLTGKPLGKKKKKGKNHGVPAMKKTTQAVSEDPNTFLSFVGDVQGFMGGMNEFRPLINPFRSAQVNAFGEMLPL